MDNVHLLLIANPQSTSQTAELFRRVVPKLLAIDGLTLETRFTHYSGHAEEMVRGMTRADADVIVPAGGDGTVNEVINGLLGNAGERLTDWRDVPAMAVLAVVPICRSDVPAPMAVRAASASSAVSTLLPTADASVMSSAVTSPPDGVHFVPSVLTSVTLPFAPV